ncbi:hypothetical protein OXX59_007100 [Metschnikowia pulcherrima]
MLALTALLSLATFVFADETFTLTAQGENINSKVGVANSKLVLNNEAATFILQTPSGYLTANGQNVVLTPQGIEVSDSNQSKDFGVEDGKLRSGPSSDKFDFYSCPDGTLANWQCDGGVAISLLTGDAAQTSTETSASSQASSTHASSSHASSVHSSSWTEVHSSSVTKAPVSGNSTVTDVHSTLKTITSCSDDACHSTASVSSYEGAAAQAKYAAGAIAVAGALLL